MIKKKLLLLCLTSTWLIAFSQSGTDHIPKIMPPSPNAAALEKFLTLPVDYSTGVPSISYPMWSWQHGKLQFNIGLSYHAGGHKVDDMAPNTGLGWALTGGPGRVTRTIRGLPDDNRLKGFMYTPILPQVTTYVYSGDEYYFTDPAPSEQEEFPANTLITPYNTSYSDTIRQINENLLDGEQDIFSYSLGGASGRFVIDKEKNIVPLEYTRVKIEMICNPDTPVLSSSAGKIIAFKITDDKGVVYKFDFEEGQGSSTISNTETLTAYSFSNVSSSWLLTKIIDPTTSDSIVFNYAHNLVASQYETSFSQSQTWGLELLDGRFTVPSVKII